MSQVYHLIEYKVENRVATITLNRPNEGNALNDVMIIELRDAFQAAQVSGEAKVIVLKGSGSAFCVGSEVAYLRKLQEFNLDQNQADSASIAQLFLSIYKSPKVVIAQVEGNAEATGCGLMTVCDFVFATPESRIGFPDAQTGLVPALSMPFVLRKIGDTRGRELMLGAELIDAATAESYHLINKVVEASQIESFVSNYAQKLCNQNSFAAMQLTKKMMADVQDFPLENAIKFGAKMNAHARMTDDSKRGIDALVQNKQIRW